MENKLLHIRISDWENFYFKDETKYDEFLEIIYSENNEKCFFNYYMMPYDQAMLFFITTTKQDLIEHGFEELVTFNTVPFFRVTPLEEEINLIYPLYNKEIWNKRENGKVFFYENAINLLNKRKKGEKIDNNDLFVIK